jgi:molybdate transport system substrate-binding protein
MPDNGPVVAATMTAYGRVSTCGALGARRKAWNDGSPRRSTFAARAVLRGSRRRLPFWEASVVFNAKHICAIVAATLALTVTAQQAAAQQKSLLVFAAASMKNALDDVNAAFTRENGGKVVASYAASSALMKQIEQGAPADVFLSADIDWMDYGAKHGLIKTDSRFDLLGNRLVLIAPKDSAIGHVDIGPGFNLAALAGNGRVAAGDVRAVPAGLYAKAALEKLGAWAAIEPKLAMAESVRAALVLVARGEAPLGIVYETDAKIEPAVKIVGVFPDDSHPPIVYPVALTTNAKPEAAPYLAFLRTQQAKVIFERYGFNVLVKPAR